MPDHNPIPTDPVKPKPAPEEGQTDGQPVEAPKPVEENTEGEGDIRENEINP